MSVPSTSAAILRRALLKIHNRTTAYHILSSFAYIMIARGKLKRYRAYSRLLLMHLKRHPTELSREALENGLFPKPKVYKQSKALHTCPIHDCPVSYVPVGTGGRCGGAKPCPGAVDRICQKKGKACRG